MEMVGVDYGSYTADSQPKSSGLVLDRRPLGAVLHSSNEPGELSQWLCHDDSTINVVFELLLLFFIIIIACLMHLRCNCCRLSRIIELLLVVNPLECKGNYSATSNKTKLVHWPLMSRLLHLVQRGGDWAGPQPAQAPRCCTKCNSPLINGRCTNHRIAV